LPFGPGKHFLAGTSGVVGRVLEGWHLNGITTFSTGQYESAGLPIDWPNLGTFSSSLPDRIGNAYPASKNYNDWLNINSFVFPGCPSYVACTTTTGHIQGNAGRNSLIEPGINNWDFSITKSTRIKENTNLEFRAEFFNGWNHEQFGPENSSLVAGQFGRISSSLEPPREVQFALRLVF